MTTDELEIHFPQKLAALPKGLSVNGALIQLDTTDGTFTIAIGNPDVVKLIAKGAKMVMKALGEDPGAEFDILPLAAKIEMMEAVTALTSDKFKRSNRPR